VPPSPEATGSADAVGSPEPAVLRGLNHPYEVLFGRWSVGVGLVVVLGALFLPLEGLGLDLCYVKSLTGLPCPGCGLTRSVLHTSHGQPLAALQFNPFGPLILGLFSLSVSSLAWPRSLKERARSWLGRHGRIFKRGYLAVVAAFVVYGVLRAALFALGWWPFPV
jgi:hypothetical protein